jgi:hypothetical protein
MGICGVDSYECTPLRFVKSNHAVTSTFTLINLAPFFDILLLHDPLGLRRVEVLRFIPWRTASGVTRNEQFFE